MNEMELYDAIWDRSKLIFTDEDRAKLKAATVSLNGLGGIASIVRRRFPFTLAAASCVTISQHDFSQYLDRRTVSFLAFPNKSSAILNCFGQETQ